MAVEVDETVLVVEEEEEEATLTRVGETGPSELGDVTILQDEDVVVAVAAAVVLVVAVTDVHSDALDELEVLVESS